MAQKFVIRNIDAALAGKEERYFSENGFELGAKLVDISKAQKFGTKIKAMNFHRDMMDAGYHGFRIESVDV